MDLMANDAMSTFVSLFLSVLLCYSIGQSSFRIQIDVDSYRLE